MAVSGQRRLLPRLGRLAADSTRMATSRSLLESTARYYNSTFQQHGPTARGVDWPSGEGQGARFRALDRLWWNSQDLSMCDFGCGYGAYASHLRTVGYRGPYVGIDLSEQMISHAQQQLADMPGLSFQVGDAPVCADFVVASGVFNVVACGPRETWADHVWRMVGQMCSQAVAGVAFNMLLETSVPYRDRADLFWAKPEAVCDRLGDLGLKPQVVTGYGLHEATYIARR